MTAQSRGPIQAGAIRERAQGVGVEMETYRKGQGRLATVLVERALARNRQIHYDSRRRPCVCARDFAHLAKVSHAAIQRAIRERRLFAEPLPWSAIPAGRKLLVPLVFLGAYRPSPFHQRIGNLRGNGNRVGPRGEGRRCAWNWRPDGDHTSTLQQTHWTRRLTRKDPASRRRGDAHEA